MQTHTSRLLGRTEPPIAAPGANRIPKSGRTPGTCIDANTGELFWSVDWGFLPGTATGAKLPGSRTLAEGRQRAASLVEEEMIRAAWRRLSKVQDVELAGQQCGSQDHRSQMPDTVSP